MPQNLHQDEQKIDGYLQQRRNTSSFELLQLFCKPEHTTISSHFFWDPIMTFFPNAPPDDQNFWILCQRIRITLYDLLNAYQIPMLSKTNLQSSRVLAEKNSEIKFHNIILVIVFSDIDFYYKYYKFFSYYLSQIMAPFDFFYQTLIRADSVTSVIPFMHSDEKWFQEAHLSCNCKEST